MKTEALENLKDERGQVSFGDAVYFDEELTDGEKLFWLETCQAEGKPVPPGRIEELRQKTAAAEKAEIVEQQ